MSGMDLRLGHVAPALLLAAGSVFAEVLVQDPWILSCDSVFTREVSAADLARRFGAGTVSDVRIHLGEGFYENATVLFPDSADLRVEILWADTLARCTPRAVRIRGRESRWHTPTGLTLGLDLHTVEAINRRPFRLMGFGWDYEGTVVSWSGGLVDVPDSSACSVRARLRPEVSSLPADQEKWWLQVQGDHEFSSGHRAMMSLNPRVFEVWLDYRR